LLKVTTPGGGRFWTDGRLLALLEFAQGKTYDEILKTFPTHMGSIKSVGAALDCLARAGFIEQTEQPPSSAEGPPINGPLVSAIMVGFNSRRWLEVSLPTLLDQTYSPLEIILVDNGSEDGTAAWLNRQYPSLMSFPLSSSQPLARALNQGIGRAKGEYFLLLNPDITLDKEAVAEMVAVAERDGRCAAVAAKLKLSRAPGFLNGLGNYVGPFSWGTDWGLGHLDLGQFDDLTEVPSACFAATLIKKKAWEKTGPLDEGFPLYYEDSEWCYRARLFGWRIRPAPRAVIFHAMGETGSSDPDGGPKPAKIKSVVYGRIRFALKLLGRDLPRFLVTYGLEDGFHFLGTVVRGRWLTSRAYLAAWGKIIQDLLALKRERRWVQGQRVLTDRKLFALQKSIPKTFIWKGLPVLTWDLVEHHYAPLLSPKHPPAVQEIHKVKPSLLIISHDLVDNKMAGPGIRYLEMARVLNRLGVEVTLAIPGKTSLNEGELHLVSYDEKRPERLQALVEKNDVTLISGYLIKKFSFFETTRSRLVVDLYDPLVLENLLYNQREPLNTQKILHRQTVDLSNTLAQIGDFFICGNERQRDYWLGLLTANHRINPLTFSQDPSLRRLIDIVGIGLPDRAPKPRPFVRGIHPLIPKEARLVLWGGGIWNWLDPLTLVEAWPQVAARHPEARLIFLGTRHPNPLVPVHEMARKTEQKAREFGEKDRTILFFEWLSYSDRESLLGEADIGVTLHPVHVETRYSLRTRVLDYIWARLPILITEGDITSEWVREYQLGKVVPPFNARGVTEGLLQLLEKPKTHWSANFEPLHSQLAWASVIQPLVRYCLEGSYAPDRMDRLPVAPVDLHGEIGWLSRAGMIWRHEGFRALVYRGWRYLQWRLART
jgi:GT2 family glycosyltransferase/glycosyltransferase involved in cell wall biosynthesis